MWSILSSAYAMMSDAILNRATPPPGSMPSSKADRTAQTASSTLSYLSFCSTSEPPPTYITPTPPVRDAMRSFRASLSPFLVELLCCIHSCSTRSLIASFEVSLRTRTVLSLPTITRSALPRWSIVIKDRSSPVCSLKYLAPTASAMSCISSCCL